MTTNDMKPFDLPQQQGDVRTPDIMLSGATVDKMILYLRTEHLAQLKGADGNFHPVVDPNFIIGILVEAARQEAQRQGLIPSDGQSQTIQMKPN